MEADLTMQQTLPRRLVHRCQPAASRTAQRAARRPAQGPRRGPCRLNASDNATATAPGASKGSAAPEGTGSKESEGSEWVPVFKPEELPKGTRREAKVEGVDVMLFWYKNSIRAIEARSPAEGAYSQGFMSSVFTQNNEIACPGTGTLFNLDDGRITDWYPSNPVLRLITPQDTCRNLQIFPVKLTQEAIFVDVSSTTTATGVRGGAETSAEENNVFALQPSVYLEGSTPTGEADGAGAPDPNAVNPYTLAINVFALACVGAAGTAGAIYYENKILLYGLWAILLVVAVRGLFGLFQKEE